MKRTIGAAALLLALLAFGCSGSDRPRVAFGAPCAGCSMNISDARFACVRGVRGHWRSYDSIECLLRDLAGTAGAAWLADYDTRALHPADSIWVVKGEFPSPMGGGYAAFASRAAADEIAARAHGSVARLEAWGSEVRR